MDVYADLSSNKYTTTDLFISGYAPFNCFLLEPALKNCTNTKIPKTRWSFT